MSTNVPILGATVKFDADLKLFTDKVSEVRSIIDGLTGSAAKVIPFDPSMAENARAAAASIEQMSKALDKSDFATKMKSMAPQLMEIKREFDAVAASAETAGAKMSATFSAACAKAKELSLDLKAVKSEMSGISSGAEEVGAKIASAFSAAGAQIRAVGQELSKLIESLKASLNAIMASIAEATSKYEELSSKAAAASKKVVEENSKAQTKSASDSASSLDSVIGKWFSLSAAIKLARIAIEAFTDSTKRAFEIYRASAKFGINVQELQYLSIAANDTGLNLTELSNALRYMETNIGKAQTGVKLAVSNLALLGFTAQDLKGKLPEEQLAMLADSFVGIEDPARRSEIAMAIFGRQGANIIPLLSLGGTTLREMSIRAKELGSTLDEKALKALKNAQVAGLELHIALGNLASNLSTFFAGSVTDATKVMTEFSASSTRALESYNKWGKTDSVMGKIFLTVDNLKVLTAAWTDFFKVTRVIPALIEFGLTGTIKSNTLAALENIGAVYRMTDAQAAAAARAQAKADAVAASLKNEALANQKFQEVLAEGARHEAEIEKEREKFRKRKDMSTASSQLQAELEGIVQWRKEAMVAAEEAAKREGMLAREKGAEEWKVAQIVKDRLDKETASVNMKTMEKAAAAEAFRTERMAIEAREKSEVTLKKLEDDAAAGRLASAREHLKEVQAANIPADIQAAKALVEAAGRKDANDELKKAQNYLARIAGSYQDQVDALVELRGYQTDEEKSLAAQVVATRMLADDTKKLAQEEETRKKTIEQIFEREREALANLGKSQAQLNVLKLQAVGATEKEVAAFQALADKHDRDAKALSDRKKEEQDAKSLLESAMTKEEKLAESIAQVRRFEADQIYTKEQAQRVINSLLEKENKLRKETVGMYSDGLSLVRAMSAAGLADEKTGRAGGRFGGVVPVPVPAPMPPAPAGLPGVVNSVMDRIATLNEGILAILSRWDTDGIKIKSLPPITATYA